MLLSDVMKMVDRFSPEELRELREYIQQREQQSDLRAGTVDMNALLAALDEIRDGMTEEEFSTIERAMNEEFIEPLDADL